MRVVGRTLAYLVGTIVLLLLGSTHGTSAQSAQNRAGLVVQFGDGSVRSYCLAFSGDSISGIDLLLKSGLDVRVEGYGGMGGLVCKIGAEGCDYPGEGCVCKSYGPQGVYWTYHHLRGGVWKTSSIGAGSYRVRNGEVEGWAWSGGKPPIVRTFEQICSSTQVQATSTRKPATITPRPPPTSTPKPPTAKPPTITRPPLKATNTMRAATATRVPAKPQPTATRTKQPANLSPTKTAIKKASPTRQPARPIATATPKKAVVVASPTKRTPQATATPIRKEPTVTKTRTRTRTPTPIATRTRTIIPPTIALTPTLTPIRIAVATLPNTPIAALTSTDQTRPPVSDTARTVSIAIGASVIGGLLVWGGVMFATRRTPHGKHGKSTHAG